MDREIIKISTHHTQEPVDDAQKDNNDNDDGREKERKNIWKWHVIVERRFRSLSVSKMKSEQQRFDGLFSFVSLPLHLLHTSAVVIVLCNASVRCGQWMIDDLFNINVCVASLVDCSLLLHIYCLLWSMKLIYKMSFRFLSDAQPSQLNAKTNIFIDCWLHEIAKMRIRMERCPSIGPSFIAK